MPAHALALGLGMILHAAEVIQSLTKPLVDGIGKARVGDNLWYVSANAE